MARWGRRWIRTRDHARAHARRGWHTWQLRPHTKRGIWSRCHRGPRDRLLIRRDNPTQWDHPLSPFSLSPICTIRGWTNSVDTLLEQRSSQVIIPGMPWTLLSERCRTTYYTVCMVWKVAPNVMICTRTKLNRKVEHLQQPLRPLFYTALYIVFPFFGDLNEWTVAGLHAPPLVGVVAWGPFS